MHSHTNNIVVFHDPAYPQACSTTTLRELVPGSFDIVEAAQLEKRLAAGCRLLVSFHGPYFPKGAWRALLRFLENGGHMAMFGGMPFARPVNDDGEVEPEQDAYTRQIYLGPFFQVEPPNDVLRLVADDDAAFLKNCSLALSTEQPGRFWSFYPKLTQVSDHPEDNGSAGPLDTILQPLIFALATTATGEEKVATPALVLDQRSGRFKGGRWLISAWEPGSEEDWLANADVIQRLIALAAAEVTSFEMRPALACYQLGEAPALLITARSSLKLRAAVTVYRPDSDEVLQAFDVEIPASPVQYEKYLQLPPQHEPGLYLVNVEYQASGGQPLGNEAMASIAATGGLRMDQEAMASIAATGGLRMGQESGFWIWDESLVEATSAKRLVAGRDYFYQGEQGEHVFPVCGTTYMDSSVQRKFLHLPNPARWDMDMAEMKAAGINLLRTGIWTAWREFVPTAGLANEAFLRALDAFVMTVCKYDLQLIFTFFSFFPPLFEGENPWLDPRSIEAQQDFVALLARRYAHVELVSWDLINEPSFGDPARIFALRPVPHYDHFEIDAFRRWLKERYSLAQLQLRWRLTPADLPDWDHVQLPHKEDYATDIRDVTVRGKLKVADYTRFSQDMFVVWAAQMVKAIRAAGSETLIGVGQDEAGARIAPQFYASAVDYTTTHPWWNIDDLLWDMLIDKTPTRPNLIQETGVMVARDVDGRPWRSEHDNAYLLERKLITGLIANGAGLIQWLWHTNGYMTSDNENGIGLVRADGSAKPELVVMKEFCRLMRTLNGQLVEAPAPPDVWVVIPYSQWFVLQPQGPHGTQRAIRVLAYDLGIIPQMVGEQQLCASLAASQRPRLIIIPAVQMFDQKAWDRLLQYVHEGGTVLANGIISRDGHNLPFDPRVDSVDKEPAPVPVSRHEKLEEVGDRSYEVTFTEEKIGYVKKAHNRLNIYRYGAGTLLWCGLPLELASESSVIETIYQQALYHAHFSTEYPMEHLTKSQLVSHKSLKDGELFLLVSESSCTQQIELAEGTRVSIAPNRAGALILRPGQKPRAFGGISCLT